MAKDAKDIFIIGAGPVGLYLAKLLADSGNKVSVFEEHKMIGMPIQCSGILTKAIEKIVPIKRDFFVNKFKKARIYSKHCSLEFENDDILVNRAKFDNYLANEARKSGVKIFSNHKFIGEKDGMFVFSDSKNQFVKKPADIIVGADGPLSDVAKFYGMFGKREFYVGAQARIRGKFDKSCYEVYFGSIAPDFFAWVIPESDTVARIGVGSRTKVAEKFNRFMKIKGFNKKQIIEYQGGLIPIYKKAKLSKNNAFLVGDAAMQVKATTGGGIVPGLKAAKILAKCISAGKPYDKELKPVHKELGKHLLLRKILNNFSDKDYDGLFKLLNQKRIKRILKKIDRDNAAGLIFSLVFSEPRLLKYITKIC